MKITRYNYGSLLPSEDKIISQGRDFAECKRTANEVANILFPVIESLEERIAELEEYNLDLRTQTNYRCADVQRLTEKLATIIKTAEQMSVHSELSQPQRDVMAGFVAGVKAELKESE
jgi:Mg2+ and Co2+ transporter CorA